MISSRGINTVLPNVNAKLMCHKSAPIHCQELL